ncbi:MAG: hypothetical protein F6K21_05330 [Symploca sp. SIO2D2]|nr:hypothetical protein [Symploca sp. SIO2D2]NEQ64918.1 hypothetical protein [Symploca sp. SIO2D2]
MTQVTLPLPTVQAVQPQVDSSPPFYPQCYLYQPSEVELDRNLSRLDILLFSAGVSLESAHQAAKVITSIKPGFIISRAEYQAIHQAFSEMK